MTNDPGLAKRVTKLESQTEAMMAVIKLQGKKIATLQMSNKSCPVLIEGKWVRNDDDHPSLNPRKFT